MVNNVKDHRAEMPYNTQVGKYYLLQRKKSLEIGLSKSLTIPYVINYLNKAENQSNVPTIIDFGCSDGAILNQVHSALSDKVLQLIGVDFNTSVIKKAKEDYPKFDFKRIDIVQDKMRKYKNTANVALCINTLHEIFSFYSYNGEFNPKKGIDALEKAVKNITNTLKPGGVFIIFDGVETYQDLDREITIKLKNKEVEEKLLLFQEGYKPYKIKFEKVGRLKYKIDLKSFTRFITKYRFLDSIVWELEKEESYQYFNKFEFNKLFKKNGLQMEAMNLISPNLGHWSELVEIQDPKTTFPYEHILIIGKKL